MNLKKLLTVALVGALFVGTVATPSAAELDLAWYAAKNPDVVAAFGNSPEMLKLHYDMFGRKEARMANSHDTEAQLRKMFNPTEYATLYPDVKAALGENAEAMFQHYMAFGLLESRRPSEKVSKETAATLKKAVEKALASAGIPALPGSAQLVAALTGEIKADVVGGAAVQQALTQVASVVEKAVVETVQKVNNPSSGGGGGSSSSSTPTSKAPETPKAARKAIWARLVDKGNYGSINGQDVTHNEIQREYLDGLNQTGDNNLIVEEKDGITYVTVKSVTIPKHSNNATINDTNTTYWCGIGVPYVSGNDPEHETDAKYEFSVSTAVTASNAKTKVNDNALTDFTTKVRDSYMTVDGKHYATFYFGQGWATLNKDEQPGDLNSSNQPTYVYGCLVVKDKTKAAGSQIVAKYIIDFGNITFTKHIASTSQSEAAPEPENVEEVNSLAVEPAANSLENNNSTETGTNTITTTMDTTTQQTTEPTTPEPTTQPTPEPTTPEPTPEPTTPEPAPAPAE